MIKRRSTRKLKTTTKNLALDIILPATTLEDPRSESDKAQNKAVSNENFFKKFGYFPTSLQDISEKQGVHTNIMYVFFDWSYVDDHSKYVASQYIQDFANHCLKTYGGPCFKIAPVFVPYPVEGFYDTFFLSVTMRHSLNCEQYEKERPSTKGLVGGKSFILRGPIHDNDFRAKMINSMNKAQLNIIVTQCKRGNHFFICGNEKDRAMGNYYNDNFKPLSSGCNFTFDNHMKPKYSIPEGCKVTRNGTFLDCSQPSANDRLVTASQIATFSLGFLVIGYVGKAIYDKRIKNSAILSSASSTISRFYNAISEYCGFSGKDDAINDAVSQKLVMQQNTMQQSSESRSNTMRG